MDSNDRRRFLYRSGCAATLVAGTAGCLGGALSSDPVKKTRTIRIEDGAFNPKNVHVERRSKVTIENRSETGHRVTSVTQGLFLDDEVGPQQVKLFDANQDGVYRIFLDYDKEETEAEAFEGERMKLAVGTGTIEEPVE